jgi:mono/diheme cytochrome c family protein
MPDPYGTAGTLEQRARAYLHTNCSQCHRPGGPTSVNMDLRYTTALANTNACDVVPVNSLGIANARRIAIGGVNPAARSLVIQRASLTDANSMPPFQPRQVDTAGVQLLSDWVSSLASCN